MDLIHRIGSKFWRRL